MAADTDDQGLPIKGNMIEITGFKPPADAGDDDPTQDDDYRDMLFAFRTGSMGPDEPIRVTRDGERFRLASREDWKAWLACIDPKAPILLGLLSRDMVDVVEPGCVPAPPEPEPEPEPDHEPDHEQENRPGDEGDNSGAVEANSANGDGPLDQPDMADEPVPAPVNTADRHPWDTSEYHARQRPPTEEDGWAIEFFAIADLQRDPGVQSREEMSESVVDEYGAAISDGIELPPGVVFVDDEDGERWVADGFHRLAGAEQASMSTYPAWCRSGARREAILYAVGSNATHGLRRTNADKRKAVTVLLSDDDWSQWSDREIARRCAVSNVFVSKVRNELSVNGSQMKKRKVRRGDTEYEMNAAKRKKAKKKAKKKASTGKADTSSTDDEGSGEDEDGEQDDQKPDGDEDTGIDAADGESDDGDELDDEQDDSPDPDDADESDEDEDDDDEGSDEPDDKVKGDPDEEDEIPLRDALGVVCEHLAVTDREKAARIIEELARRASIDCWTGTDEGESEPALSDLMGHLRRELERYAREDHDSAVGWLEAAIEEMWEEVNDHAPQREDDSGW